MNDAQFFESLPDTDGGSIAALIRPGKSAKYEKPKPEVFEFVSASEMLADHAPPVWLIDDMLEAGTLSQVFGASGSGKSFLVMDWAASIATGNDWNGKSTARGAVFYIAGEGFSGFKRRLRAWEMHNNLSLDCEPLFFSKKPAALMDSTNANAVMEAVKALEAKHGKPALIVVDTLHRNMGDGDENSAGDISLFLQSLDALRNQFGAAVLVVHHSGHADSGRGRGSSSLRAAVDHEYLMTKHPDERREVACTKSKDSEPPPSIWLDLKNVPLDWEDGRGGWQSSAILATSCDQGAPEINKAKKLTGALRIAYKALEDALVASGEDTPESVLSELGIAAPSRVVHEEAWRKRCYSGGIADGSQEAKKKSFQRARKELVAREMVKTWDDFYWLFGVCFSLDNDQKSDE